MFGNNNSFSNNEQKAHILDITEPYVFHPVSDREAHRTENTPIFFF